MYRATKLRNSVFKGEDSVVSSFSDALKRVLIDKVHLSMDNKYPPRIGIEKSVQQHFDLFSLSEKKKEYYNEEKMLAGKTDFRLIISKYFINYCSKIAYKSKRLLNG